MAAQSMSGIYEIVNLINGKRYVGSAVSIKKRWNEHRSDLRRNLHHSRALQRAFLKYGEANFQFSVIEYCERERLIEKEQAAFDRLDPEYNICRVAGSMMGVSPSVETRSLLSAAMKGREFSDEHRRNIAEALAAKRASGWCLSPETRALMADKRRGSKASAETKAKLSAARQGRPSPMLGKRHSEETKQKISERHKANPTFLGKKHSDEARAKIRAKAIGRKPVGYVRTEEHIRAFVERSKGNTIWRGRKHSEESRRKIAASKENISDETRRRMSHAQRLRPPTKPETRAKMSARRQGHGNSAAIKVVFSLRHEDGSIVAGTPIVLRAATGISPAGMSQLIRGKQERAKGWRMISHPE